MATLTKKDTSGIYLAQSGEFEKLSDRTRAFKKFHGPNRVVRIAGQLGPIHYKLNPFDEAEEYKEIDLDILATPSADWDAACETNGYQVRIWDSQFINENEVRCVAQFRRANQWINIAPYALVWENAVGETQLISNCTPPTTFDIDNDNYRITWKNAFGEGIDYRYNLQPDEFFKTVVIRNQDSLPIPIIDTVGLKLTVILGIAWSADSNLATGFSVDISPQTLPEGILDTIVDEEIINSNLFSCKDSFLRDVFWLQKPKVWDSADMPHVVELDWRLQRKGSNVFALLDLPATYLEDFTTEYPVYFDVDISEELVGASSDDCRRIEGTGGTFSTVTPKFSSGSLTATEYNIRSGVRYTTLPIPVAANIISASLSLYAQGSSGDTFASLISGNDIDNAVTFTTVADFDGRDVTTGHINWVVGDWTNGTWYTSSDLHTLIQEIIDRPGWVPDNAIALFWDYNLTGVPVQPIGDGYYQDADSYDTSPATAPRFNLSYIPSGSGPTTLDADTEWEVRDTEATGWYNGGGFADLDPGTSVDYSQQDVAQLTLTDLAMTAGTTILTSAVGGFTAAMVGNVMYIRSGVNFVANYYQVTGFNNGNSIELDRDATTGSNASGGSGKLGGAISDMDEFFLETVHAGNTIWIKYGSYTQFTDIQAANGGTPTAYIKIYGYYNTRGDTPRGNKRPLMDTDSERFELGAYSGDFWDVRNLRFDHAFGFGITISGSDSLFMNCKIDVTGNLADGFEFWQPAGRIIDCEVIWQYGTGMGIVFDNEAVGCIADSCYVEGMRWGLETHGEDMFFFDCILYYNKENHLGPFSYIKNCTIHGGDKIWNTNGVAMLYSAGPPYTPVTAINCIFSDCGAGFEDTTAVWHYLDYCIFWNNFDDLYYTMSEAMKGPHCTTKNPLYVKEDYVPDADFRLRVGSTVLNAGMTLHEGSEE